MKLQELRRVCREEITRGGAARPEYSADVIISRSCGYSRAELLYKDDEVARANIAKIARRVSKRAKGVPLSYVVHEAEFYGRPFKVGRGVLIPRPETELLAEAALEYFPLGSKARFADWCTGSACIACSLISENPALSGVAVDASGSALCWANINIRLHGLEKKLSPVRNEVPENAPIEAESLDFITANPPYIKTGELNSLMKEVRDFEPVVALDGGEDGTRLYRAFFRAFPKFLKKNGLFFCETAGGEQIETLCDMARGVFSVEKKISDYNGITRHIVWRKLK